MSADVVDSHIVVLCEGFVRGRCQLQAVAHSQEVAGEFQDGSCDVIQRSTSRRGC